MDNLERLQGMFPSVDVDVISIVFSECDNNSEYCTFS